MMNILQLLELDRTISETVYETIYNPMSLSFEVKGFSLPGLS